MLKLALNHHPDIAYAHLFEHDHLIRVELNNSGHEKLKSMGHTEWLASVRNTVIGELKLLLPKLGDKPIIKYYVSEENLTNITGNKWPSLLSMRQTQSSAEFNIWIQPDLVWFNGHFPQHQLLAGVVQIHWASVIAQRLFGLHADANEISNLKFQQIIEPRMQLLLALDYSKSKGRLQFRYSGQSGDHSKGSIQLL